MSNKFPLKLMSILDSNEHNEIISWLPHGRGFIIRDKRRLADEVLPKYFKESKYTSFTRRLNRWNFTIQTHGHKEASYFHPMFIRGDPQRSLEMHPTPQASNKARESRYIDVHVNDSKRSNANASLVMAMSNPSAGYSGGMVNVGAARSSMPLPALEGGSSGLRGAAAAGQYATMDDAMARADVSAQVMAAGGAAAAAGNANDPYLDQYRAQAGVQHPHHALAHAQQNVTVMSAPLQTLQLANAPIQPQFYGQAVAVNPMYASHHQPHNAPHAQPNYSREIIYSRMPMERDVNVSTGMPREQYQTHNGMVIIQHPQLGTATPVVHPQMQQQFGDYSHYIPTTPASHAHLQARYGHASTPGHVDPSAQAQMQQARAMQHQVQYINPPGTPVNAAAGSAPLGIHQYSAMNYPPQGQAPPAAALKSQVARNQNAGAKIGASFDAAATKPDSTGKESGTEKDAKEDGAKNDKASDEKGGDAKAKEEAIATATASEEKEKLATEEKEKKENESASAPNSEKEKEDDEAKKPMEPKEDPKEAASESEAEKSTAQSEKAANAPSSATTKRSADSEPSSQPPEKKAKSPSPPPAGKTEKNASSESAKKEDEGASVNKKNGELTI